MSTLFRVRPGGLFRTKSILQQLDETDGAVWRDVTYRENTGIFTCVALRYWQQVEAKFAQQAAAAATRRAQRAAKKRPAPEFAASQFTDTRMPSE